MKIIVFKLIIGNVTI